MDIERSLAVYQWLVEAGSAVVWSGLSIFGDWEAQSGSEKQDGATKQLLLPAESIAGVARLLNRINSMMYSKIYARTYARLHSSMHRALDLRANHPE